MLNSLKFEIINCSSNSTTNLADKLNSNGEDLDYNGNGWISSKYLL